jgi:hypothetical protein
MSDDALNRFGQAARCMCSSAASHGNESTFKTYKMHMAARFCLPEYVPRITRPLRLRTGGTGQCRLPGSDRRRMVYRAILLHMMGVSARQT